MSNLINIDDLDSFRSSIIGNYSCNQNNGELVRNLCWLGRYELVKYLIETYPELEIHHKNENAFKGACLGSHNNIEMAKLLLDNFPYINIHIDNDYIFKIACERNLLSVIELYLERCPQITSYEDIHTGFLLSFEHNHNGLIKLLVSKYPTLLESNYEDAWYLACKYNYIDLIQWLDSQPHYDQSWNKIFSLELKEDMLLWLYKQGYYNKISVPLQKEVLYKALKRNQRSVAQIVLEAYPEWCEEVVNLGSTVWSYDVSYILYKILDEKYLTEPLCTQAIKYCLKNNLIDDCRCLIVRPHHITKLDLKMLCYEIGDNGQKIKDNYYEIVELMASTNDSFKKLYLETLMYQLQKSYLNDDIEAFIFYMNKNSELDRYEALIEASRCNSLKIVQCLLRSRIIGKYEIPQDVASLIITLALKKSHPMILQYMYTTYSDYSDRAPKDFVLGHFHKKISTQLLTNLIWLRVRYPIHKKRFETVIRQYGPQFKIVDHQSSAICMICKISHEEIIKLPCGHYICFDQICHFQVEANTINLCLACRTEYSWTQCSYYSGKKSLFPFL